MMGMHPRAGKQRGGESLSPSRESSSTGWLEDHCKAERTASTPLSLCPPTIPWPAGNARKGEDVEVLSPFPPLPQCMAGCATPSLPAEIIAPCGCPTKAMAEPRMCPLGTVTCGEHYKREPHRRTLLSLGENGDTAAAKCADLSSGSGAEGSPRPGARSP